MWMHILWKTLTLRYIGVASVIGTAPSFFNDKKLLNISHKY